MSWFRDLTSKAEAILVKLDQDTAQALQKPEDILARTKLLDKAADIIDDNQDEMNLVSQEDEVTEIEDDHLSAECVVTSTNSQSYENSASLVMEPTLNEVIEPPTHPNDTSDATTSVQHVPTTLDRNQNIHKLVGTNIPTQKSETPQQARKFKLQTSKLRQPLLDKQPSSKSGTKHKFYDNHNDEITHTSLASLEADDIRASINRSLLEYSLTSSPFARPSPNGQTSFSSHFDDQPNLIRSVEEEGDHSRLNDRLHSSPSFSIHFPDNGNSRTDIAEQILLQGALKGKSSFNLHKVLNKLAGNGVQSQSIIGDKTKIRLRRAQMRVASYMRRLNYYFKAYPTMKYWAIGYLVLLQLLVIYVLFFYKSTGSSSYLASQVKLQQEELNEVNYPSRQRIISPSDLQSNRFW